MELKSYWTCKGEKHYYVGIEKPKTRLVEGKPHRISKIVEGKNPKSVIARAYKQLQKWDEEEQKEES